MCVCVNTTEKRREFTIVTTRRKGNVFMSSVNTTKELFCSVDPKEMGCMAMSRLGSKYRIHFHESSRSQQETAHRRVKITG